MSATRASSFRRCGDELVASGAPTANDHAIGMLRYSIEYFASAREADRTLGSRPGYEKFSPMPVYFMMGQALELALKAYLLSVGVTEARLRKIGHDLVKVASEAKAQGFAAAFRKQDHGLINILNGPYLAREFQYIRYGSKDLLFLGPLTGLVVTCIRAAMEAIPGAATLKTHPAYDHVLGVVV